MIKLSILIPSRSEPYLQQTIEDIFEHSEADTEILIALDNCENSPALVSPGLMPVTIVSTKLGQRGATNALAKLAKGEYLLKIDAHCSFTQGFDRIMLEDANENDLLAIDLRDLDVKTWQMKPEPLTSQVVFNNNYELVSAPEKPGLIAETQCIHGVGFMVSKELYQKLNLCDEAFGSYGLMGLEVPLKIWLSGGTVRITKKAQMGHWYKQGEAVPYPRNKEESQKTYDKVKEWAKGQNLSWLIEKFNYPADWTQQKVVDRYKSVV